MGKYANVRNALVDLASVAKKAAAKAKNSSVSVEYVDRGINKSKDFNSAEEAERWAKLQGLKKGDPQESGSEKEYRIIGR